MRYFTSKYCHSYFLLLPHIARVKKNNWFFRSSKMSEETNQVPEIVETPAETIEKVRLLTQCRQLDL